MKTGWKLAAVGMMMALTVACCRKAPKEVGDATAALGDLQKSCAPVYAESAVQDAQSSLDRANDLVANRKCRDAKKEALVTMDKVKAAAAASSTEQDRAMKEAEAAIASAKESLKAAEDAQAPQYAAATYQQAKNAIDEAEQLMKASPCNYYKSRDAAKHGMDLAMKAKSEAEAEIARIKAEEERKRLEAEAALRAHPVSYTVQKGDCLWKISAQEKIYANPFLWPLIWDANRDLIKNHPDLIHPDWTLKINRDYTDADAKKAEKTARNHHWEPAAPEAPKAMTTAPAETPAPANP
jgi:nucleoid-associated protein YgaU